MFVVLYEIEVASGKQSIFIESWCKVTDVIAEHHGGLGSRLHDAEGDVFIAYAQWPDKKSWELFREKGLHVSGQLAADTMNQSVNSFSVLRTMNVSKDKLVNSVVV